MPSECHIAVDKNRKELSEHGSVLFPIACYADDFAINPIAWHWHDEFEFVLITEGSALVHVENAVIPVMAGEAVFINSGVLHSLEKDKSPCAKYHSLVFHARLIGGSVDSIFWQNLVTPVIQDKSFRYALLGKRNPVQEQTGFYPEPLVPVMDEVWQTQVISEMADSWQAAVDKPGDYENFVRYKLSKAFRQLFLHCKPAAVKQSSRDLLYADRTKKMMQFIEAHYAEDISLEMIAESASVSKSVCLRCFHTVIGSTPVRYLVQYRIEKAAQCLVLTEKKAFEVAISCGFSDMSYFSKCFRAFNGCTPSEYRKKNIMN